MNHIKHTTDTAAMAKEYCPKCQRPVSTEQRRVGHGIKVMCMAGYHPIRMLRLVA